MGMVRNALRRLVDYELGVLGGQLDRLESRNEDLLLQILSFKERLERMQARAGMRHKRAADLEEPGARQEFLTLLKAEQQPPEKKKKNGSDDDGDWYDFGGR